MTDPMELRAGGGVSPDGLLPLIQSDISLLAEADNPAERLSPTARRLMRCIDILGASMSLVLISPVALIVWALIASTSRGSAIFRQQRVGLGGELFGVLKFRTMVVGTEFQVQTDPVARSLYERNDFKLPPDDPRITTLGRFLRKTSLDEIPQLVNVVHGEMSLVGVRPLLEHELKLRPELDQRLYCCHLPGVTGLWQVGGRSTVGEHDRFALDREYLQTWSVRSNIGILLRTPLAVLRGSGAH